MVRLTVHMIQERLESKLSRWRINISQGLICASMGLFLGAFLLITWVMVSSLIQGDWPFEYWNDWSLNHGPWRYDFGIIPNPRRYHLSDAFMLLMASVGISACSLFFSLKRFPVTIFALNVIALWLSFKYLYWLID